jgi:hypothetical protein
MGGEYYNGFWGNRIGECGLISSGFQQGPATGFCEHDNEPSVSIKEGNFFTI